MKRFKPEMEVRCESSWGEWHDYHVVVMEESPYGEWTSYQNAHDAIQMYKKRAERLEARIRRLEDELFLHCAYLPE